MNTFFKSINGRALRKYFEDNRFALRIVDFGGKQVFKSKSTYTCICIVKNKQSDNIKYVKDSNLSLKNDLNFKTIFYSNLNHKKGWNLQAAELVNSIEKTGTPFSKLYNTSNGIATLKNNIYIFKPIKEDKNFYYLQNGDIFPVEKEICKDIINPNKLTQIDNIDVLIQKTIFPYQYDKQGTAVLLAENIFQEKYPFAFSYLKNKKSILNMRDKGKGNYQHWYAYGRNQSLGRSSNKLFFPHITPHIPNFVVCTNTDLLFYNGIAVVSDDEFELHFLKKIMSSKIFWFYIINTSKPYYSGYYSLSRNYIKNFGIYNFTKQEKELIINSDIHIVNKILEDKYGISLSKKM